MGQLGAAGRGRQARDIGSARDRLDEPWVRDSAEVGSANTGTGMGRNRNAVAAQVCT